MNNFLDFFSFVLTGFSNFGVWFFTTEIFTNVYPYMLFGFGGLLIVLGFHVVHLINPFS